MILKKLFVHTCIILCYMSLFNKGLAQGINMQYDLSEDIRPGLLSFPDDKNNVVVSYQTVTKDEARQYKTHLLFKDGDQVNHLPLFGKLDIFGHSYNDTSFTFLYQNDNRRSVRTPSFELIQVSKTGKKSVSKAKLNYDKEKVLGSFHYYGKYYFLTANKKESKLILRIISTPSDIEYLEFEFDKNFLASISNIKFSLAHNDYDQHIGDALTQNKLFFNKEKLYLAVQRKVIGEANVLRIISLNLKNSSSEIKNFPAPFKSYNYFPYRDQLFILNTTPKNLTLNIHDLHSFDKLHEVFYKIEDPGIDIVNSSVFIDDKFETLRLNENLNRQKLRWLSNGQEFLSIVDHNDKIKLTFGSYKIPNDVGNFPIVGQIGTDGVALGINLGIFFSPEISSKNAIKRYAYGFLYRDDFSVAREPTDTYDFYKKADKYVETARDKKQKLKYYNVSITKEKSYLVYYIKESKKSKKIIVREW